jgi:nitrile hydratase beta subunit
MNGAHDCGGMMGFGPVLPERDEPVFHAGWERRMFGLMSLAGDIGGWTLDDDRSACESMRPEDYLTSSYYEHWLHGLEFLLQKQGLASSGEIRDGHVRMPAKRVTPTSPDAVWGAVTAPGSYERKALAPALFKTGDMVRARNHHPSTHTRLPRYLRGRMGEIVSVHGAHVFPDSNATGKGEDPQWLYTVRFTAGEVWGRNSKDMIHADLWEPYLETV